MATKKSTSTDALVTVVRALESLNDPDRQWVLQSAASKFTLTIQPFVTGGQAGVGSVSGATPPPSPGAATAADVQAALTRKDPRGFIRIKKPGTDVQRVACLGYYLVQTTGQLGFGSKDITKAHTDSGGSAINMTRALDNATRRAKYLSNRGPHEKQLTTLGEDVVDALPDQAAVKAAEEAAKGGRRKKGKKRKKSKRA